MYLYFYSCSILKLMKLTGILLSHNHCVDEEIAELREIYIAKKKMCDTLDVDDVVMLDIMTKKERSLKTKYVLKKHVTADGLPRTINEPHGKIDGWNTRVAGKKRITAATYDALIDKLFDYYSDGFSVPTFENVFELAVSEKQDFKSANTIVKYRADFNRFISTELKEMYLFDISHTYLRDYSVALIKKRNMKKEAFRAFKSVLNLVFNFAVAKDIIEYNPASKLNNNDFYTICSQQYRIAEDKAMSPEQIADLTVEVNKRIANPTAYGEKCYTNGYMFLLSSKTGMRAGELCSLKWTDIRNNKIHIHTQQLKNRKTGNYEYVLWTKNEKGISKGGRFFPVTDDIRQLLDKLKANQEEAGISSPWVFANPDGSWIIADTCYEKFLYRLCKSKFYTLTNNHAIRMYFNSYVMIPANIPVTNRAKLLGHSVEVNLKYYSFAGYDYCAQALDALEALNNQ